MSLDVSVHQGADLDGRVSANWRCPAAPVSARPSSLFPGPRYPRRPGQAPPSGPARTGDARTRAGPDTGRRRQAVSPCRRGGFPSTSSRRLRIWSDTIVLEIPESPSIRRWISAATSSSVRSSNSPDSTASHSGMTRWTCSDLSRMKWGLTATSTRAVSCRVFLRPALPPQPRHDVLGKLQPRLSRRFGRRGCADLRSSPSSCISIRRRRRSPSRYGRGSDPPPSGTRGPPASSGPRWTIGHRS